MSSMERQVLMAPDVFARQAARLAVEREQRWMLRQPRAVRRSYADEVLGRDDEELRSQIWMLRQSAEVRESYVREVLEPGLD
jgi:hypothetical protein